MSEEENNDISMKVYRKIKDGEDKNRIVVWMTSQGFSLEEARPYVDDFIFEERHGGRREGLYLILQGGGLLVLAALLFGVGKLLGRFFIFPLIMAGAFLVGIGFIAVGLFKVITNFRLL